MAQLAFERPVKVTEAHRQWWVERFSREEILWMADALFGEEDRYNFVPISDDLSRSQTTEPAFSSGLRT